MTPEMFIPKRNGTTHAEADTVPNIPFPAARTQPGDSAPHAPPPALATTPPEAVPVAAPRTAGGRARAFFWRTVRRAAALVLLAAAAWCWAVPFFFPVTGRAVVNARTVQVRAPIAGTITALAAKVGDGVEAGRPLVHVSSTRIDTTFLETLRTRASELAARRDRLERDLREMTAREAAGRARLDAYTRAVVANLEAARREGEARVAIARTEAAGADRRLANFDELADRNVVSTLEHGDNKDGAALARGRVALEAAALEKTQKELDAAARGLFLNRDAPLAQTQAEELAVRIPKARTELDEVYQLQVAVGLAVGEEERRVGRLAEAPVPAPVSGVVWKRAGNPDQVVAHNEPVVELVDRDAVFVEALLHQRHLSSVAAGCRATVNLTGGRTLTGRVLAVRTPNPYESEQAVALSLSDHDVRQVKVLIAFDPPVPDITLIGRHARVLLTPEEPGPLDRAVAWAFARLRM